MFPNVEEILALERVEGDIAELSDRPPLHAAYVDGSLLARFFAVIDQIAVMSVFNRQERKTPSGIFGVRWPAAHRL
jgi:hypothetical protein